jgi:FKBP-type peptidyl-prolyl cis-trans isomerase (trigger factor)
MNIKTTKLPKSEVEIEGELEADLFESYYKKALQKIGENVEMDGFRKGKVPENILVSKVPEITILEEMAELALADAYPTILQSEKLDVISRPEIAITKIARGNPLGFKIKTAVMPEIALPDYKKVAKETMEGMSDKEKDTSVTEEEVQNTIMDIRKSRAPKIHMQEGVELTEEEKSKEPELPEWNDEFVQAMGPFVDVNDFTRKLEENLKLEKSNMVKEKTRLKIIESIIEKSTIDTPEILINLELDKILYRMESDITQMGMKFEDYLKHLNKTVEELRTEFRPDAEKKAKLALVLNKIATEEKLVADTEEVEKEVEHILEHYKEADPERARMHAENVLTNEKIFQFLESQ